MNRPPPITTRTDTLFPDTTLFRSKEDEAGAERAGGAEAVPRDGPVENQEAAGRRGEHAEKLAVGRGSTDHRDQRCRGRGDQQLGCRLGTRCPRSIQGRRSEEHTSELQSLMRISYAVFCWKKK